MFLSILLLAVVIQPSILGQQMDEVKDERQLSQHLLTESSMFARPSKDLQKPVVVTFGFELIHLISLVESEQSISTKVWMRMSWMNEFLTWNATKWNTNVTKLNREAIWTPDIYLEEDISDAVSAGPEGYKTPITLQPNGLHSWFIPVKLTTSCEIDVTNFPFDRQSCQLKFISWTHDETELTLKNDDKPIVTDNYVNSSAWTLVGTEIYINSKKYECCLNNFTDITYHIHLNRKPKYYIYNIVFPCIIQMVIILFTFFLPPDSGERIGVVITVLLVFAVYLEIVSNSLPKTSTSTPALSNFYITAMAESALSLIATCFILAIHFKGAEKGVPPMPDWARKFFIDNLSKYVWVRKNLREYTNEGLLALKGGGVVTKDANLTNTGVEGEENNGNTMQENGATMSKLINEVCVITKLIHDLNRQDEIEEEWQILGKVLDRLFFVVFLIMFIVSSLLILVPVYIRSHQ